LCLGDSHTFAFKYTSEHYLWLHTLFNMKIVRGATAFGLANPNSKTDALNIFSNYLSSLQENKVDILMYLGEVDCGFVIWYRAEKYNMGIDEQFELSLNNYKTFIEQFVSEKARNIIICSAPLPTILDGQTWGEVANLRREVKATLRERTDLTLRYNNALREISKQNGYQFLDLEQITLDAETRLVKQEFRNTNPLDHHLNYEKLSPHIRKALKNLGYF